MRKTHSWWEVRVNSCLLIRHHYGGQGWESRWGRINPTDRECCGAACPMSACHHMLGDEEAQTDPFSGIAAGISTLLAQLHHPKWLWTWAGNLWMTLRQPGVANPDLQIHLALTELQSSAGDFSFSHSWITDLVFLLKNQALWIQTRYLNIYFKFKAVL